jgi:hypothetical protein
MAAWCGENHGDLWKLIYDYYLMVLHTKNQDIWLFINIISTFKMENELGSSVSLMSG